MLASLEEIPVNEDGAALLEEFAFALSASGRETDIFGWHLQDQELGVVFTELGIAAEPGAARKNEILNSIKQRIDAIVEGRLTTTIARKVNLSFYFFPENSPAERHSASPLHETLRREKRPETSARRIKRMIDVGGSSIVLVALSPVLLMIAVLIKLTSRGPALFRQARIGQYGKQFTFLKFRSMYVDCASTVHREYVTHLIRGKAAMQESANRKASAYKLINDSRITPFGKFLRKTSLDELPQLFNVLTGEMSLVGPRPPLPYEINSYHIWHRRRILEVKPGITGLWQVSGRSRTTFDEMVRLDLRYARSWSLLLDFVILLKTPLAVLSGSGAY
ncbi:MAG TPA: sugar transferase [Candidatus Angelobacter sp.]|nr:sugar transferase [Candidatus Angelobacter sp.]